MVAIPSKGCNTCRKRKKGCDSKKPSCGQCLSSGRHCEGYTRTHNFVAYRTPDNSSLRPIEPKATDALLKVDALNQFAYESLTVDKFWSIYLPIKELRATRFSSLSTSWYDVASCSSPEDPVLKYSLLALSLKRLSLVDASDVQRNHGIQMYGKAVRELSVALRYAERRKTDEVLYACIALVLYEVLEGSRSTKEEQMRSLGYSWLGHMEGISVLLQVRGAERHSTGMGHYQFRWLRLHGVTSALRARKSTFYDSKPWLTIPWSKHPKNLGDYILDIYACVPGMLQRFDETRSEGQTIPTQSIAKKLKTIVDECVSMDAQLQQWHACFDNFCKSHPELDWPNQLLNTPGKTPLHLSSLAHITLVYWATCILLYTNLRRAILDLKTVDQMSAIEAERHLRQHTVPAHYATNIRRGCQFFFHPALGGLGPTNASFPMGVAALYFSASGNTSELRSMLESFARLKFAQTLAGFITSLGGESCGNWSEESQTPNTAVQWWGFSIKEELLVSDKGSDVETNQALRLY